MSPCGHTWTWPDSELVRQIGLGMPALLYVTFGYAVLPLERGGKKPHRMLPPTGGVHHANADPNSVMDRWSLDPAASIGVATGRPSGIVVIDLDTKNGADGWRSLADFMVPRGLELPAPAVIAVTPSGGRHIWLRKPGGCPERPGILPGVDIKGDGGYVVAPPSMRLMRAAGLDTERSEPVPVPYEWQCGCPCTLPDAPAWLGQWLASVPERPVTAGGMSDEPAPDEAAALERGLEVGTRNRELYRLACSLYRRFGTGTAGAEVVLRRIEAVWLAGSREDMPRREVLTVVESARRFIERQEMAEREAAAASADWRKRHGT